MKLVDRVKKILIEPKTEWEVIAAENTTVADLYKSYAVLLAAIGPVASTIGLSLVGISMPMLGTFRVPFGTALAQGVVSYLLSLGGVYLAAIVIDALASNFEGQKNMMQALKVSVYASTAAWVGGIFSLIPTLSILGALAGLYSLYLLFLGLPRLMQVPQDKAITYTVVVVIVELVIFLLVGVVAGLVVSYPGR